MPLPRANVQPLLKIVNGKSREPADVTAPPIESEEDEAEEQPSGYNYVDSSDDDGPARGYIQRTTFGKSSSSNATNTANGRQSTGKGAKPTETSRRRSVRQAKDSASSNKKRPIEDIQDDETNNGNIFDSKKKAKPLKETPSSSLGDHMKDGFMVERQKKPLKAGFGRRAGRSNDSTPGNKFQRHVIPSESVSPEKTKKFKTIHPGLDTSSPAPELKAPKPSDHAGSESSELSDLESSAFSDPPRPLKTLNKKQRPNQGRPRKNKKNIWELTSDEVSQTPVFKMPEGYSDFATKADLVDMDMSLQEVPAEQKRQLDPHLAHCPMCDEPVDKEWLSKFSKNKRMSITRQAKFCQMHKKRSAQETWKSKGYPDVDWQNLESRIAKHTDFIESLIQGKASHFGEVHREKIKSGKSRTLLTTEDYPTPGYYGLRGMSVMTESLVETFSSLLRERAPKDKLISARGYTGFVQSVLVPELAVKLIQEDLDLGEDEARTVMKESQAIGEIVNDDRREPGTPTQTRAKNEVDTQDAAAPSEELVANDNKSDDDVSVDFNIPEEDDGNSDLPRLAFPGKKEARRTGPSDLRIKDTDDDDSDLSSLPSLG